MSEPKGIQSLLQYRYQRKDSDQIPVAAVTGTVAESGSQSPANSQQNGIQGPGSWYSPPTTPSKPTAVPDTPESQRPGSQGSPVFNETHIRKPGRFKRGVMVLASDSEDDPTSPVKSSASSSPWLSKQYGCAVNGHQASPSSSFTSSSQSKFSPQSSHSASQSSLSQSSRSQSSSSQKSLTTQDREKLALVSSLHDMFPGKSRELAQEALDCTPNFDKAIDFMINHNSPFAAPKKRRRIISSQSSDGDSPDHKRARQLSYEDSQESVASNGVTSSPLKEKIDFLAEAFPTTSREVLEMTLHAQNNSVELASVALSTFSPGSAVDVKQKLRVPVTIEVSDDDDSDNDVPVMNGKRPVGRPRKEDEEEEDYDDEEIEREELEQEILEENLDPILNFFNEATLDELVSLSGCSKKKAQVIVEVRPFTDWDDLVTKFESQAKLLSFSLITECKEIIRIRHSVRRLMQRCEKMTTKMEALVSGLTSETTMEDLGKGGTARAVQQPRNLNEKMKLTPYQMVGLNWLMLMHSQDLNGILGDEMGLGKTIQTIAFLAQMLQDRDPGPHLVIAPSSTIDNWMRELQLWCPDLKVVLYYGSQEERKDMRNQINSGSIDIFHVVVTSYNIASGTVEDRVFFKNIQFHYAIFDEGHMLKNMASRRYQSLMKMKADRRLLLTGTPLQNNLLELMSLLSFVMPDLFIGKTTYLRKVFTNISKQNSNEAPRGTYEQQTIAQAKRILKPFFLRRLKTDVLKQLPDKREFVERVPMAFEQQDLYDDLRKQFSRSLQETKDSGVVMKGQAGASMLMQLRKVANHHLLHRRQYDDTRLKQMAKCIVKEPEHIDANVDYVLEDMQVMSDFELSRLCKRHKSLDPYRLDEEQVTDTGKFRYLDELLPTFKSNNDRVLLFSQFTMVMDIIEVYLKSRGHKFLRLDGQTPVAERLQLIDKYNNNPAIFVFLLSTRAGGLGINLTAASKVVLHDIDFNPYNDKQAEDRCHRLGQTKEVTVYRLISKNTVEEAMLMCAQDKLRLEQDVTGSGRKDSSEASPSDVATLLQKALATHNTD